MGGWSPHRRLHKALCHRSVPSQKRHVPTRNHRLNQRLCHSPGIASGQWQGLQLPLHSCRSAVATAIALAVVSAMQMRESAWHLAQAPCHDSFCQVSIRRMAALRFRRQVGMRHSKRMIAKSAHSVTHAAGCVLCQARRSAMTPPRAASKPPQNGWSLVGRDVHAVEQRGSAQASASTQGRLHACGLQCPRTALR